MLGPVEAGVVAAEDRPDCGLDVTDEEQEVLVDIADRDEHEYGDER